MASHGPHRPAALSLLLAAGIVAATWGVQGVGPAVAGIESAIGGDPPANDGLAKEEAAIRALDDAFVREFNKGDARAVTALFSEDAEAIEADGARYRGRDLIERSYAETFTAARGVRIRLDIESIRFLSPTVAKEEGRATVAPPNASPVSRLYTVLYVKQDGRWLMASSREDADPLVAPRERIKELEWMVGEWVDDGPDSHTRVTCRRSADGNFLLRDFTVHRAGKVVMSVTQRVGWDPVAREFRSWEFDSEGGFGEGTWSRDGERWIVKQRGVRPEGETASSTRLMTRLRPDQVRWTLLDRVIAGQAAPGEESSVLTRVPPAPRLGGGKAAAPASTTPSTNPADGRAPR